jgi:hypothetical protein
MARKCCVACMCAASEGVLHVKCHVEDLTEDRLGNYLS